jgi:hypothetical protein
LRVLTIPYSVFGLRSGTVSNDPNLRPDLNNAFGLVERFTPSVTGSALHQHKRILISFCWNQPEDTVRHHPKLLEMIPCRMSWCRTWSFHNPNTFIFKASLRHWSALHQHKYSKALEYKYRVKTAALGTLKRYFILSLTLYLEWYCAYSIFNSGGPH